ncbi:uncharacterized protein [Mytilus edulis]|uniref:uncharacterized protein n=1 Tax=Mytilus edulis TaxID=6550 RepID=UPI0039F129D8
MLNVSFFSISTTVWKKPFYIIFRVFHFMWLKHVFIFYFSKYQLVSSLFTFYGLIIIVVTNISSWTYLASSSQNFSDISQNSTYRCVNNNSSLSIRHLLHKVSPFIEPMLAEYPLLCLIFLSGIWPRTSHTPGCIKDDNNVSCETSEITALLQSKTSVTRRPTTVPRKQVFTYCIILISGIISLPRLIIEVLRLLGLIGPDLFWILSITTIFECIVLLLALAVCFRAVQHQCIPHIENSLYDIGNVLLILSFILTTGYYTLYLMAKILPIVTKYRSLFIVKGILRIIVLYLHTVYILQMKKCTITYTRSRYFSVNHICLLVGLINFGY